LDRGFNNAGVVRYLQAARQPFIMPQAVHGKKPTNGPSTGLRAIRESHRTGWTRYSWTPADGGRRVGVDVCVLRRVRADRRGHRALLYACWGVRRSPTDVYRVYRLRFGVALLLRNLWSWLHWTTLAEPRRGGRRVRLERLRLRAMVNWLLHLAEAQFGCSDQTADHPPDQPLGTPRRVAP
jgi:hypothetical protein